MKLALKRHTNTFDTRPVLLPGETIVAMSQSLVRNSIKPPSELHQLYRLAQAKIQEEVGEFGPILASLALDGDGSNDTPDFHRYEALFGRDALRVAIDLLPQYPRLTRATIISLASLQGLQFSAESEEEPGRIIHEYRNDDDPIRAQLTTDLGWQWPYYGAVDATPEFIRTIAAYCRNDYEGTGFLFQKYTDKQAQPRIIADSLTFAVDWLIRRMDTNPEGLIESKTSTPKGIENQVWKDSWDSYFHEDGVMANHQKGVASIEVQRVAYDALIDAAELYETNLGKKEEAVSLRKRAQSLKEAIFTLFWTEDKGGYFVIGTDRDENNTPRQLKIRTSNMGHVLNSRLLEGFDPKVKHMRESVVTQLFSKEMLAPSGIRTLASDEIRFRPGAYHNGSVWLWDTHFIIRGLRRHGYDHIADNLSERLFNIIEVTKKFPEFVRGDMNPQPNLTLHVVDVWDEINGRTNRIEQPPQEVQAWSVAAILALKHYNSLNYSVDLRPPLDLFETTILASIS